MTAQRRARDIHFFHHGGRKADALVGRALTRHLNAAVVCFVTITVGHVAHEFLPVKQPEWRTLSMSSQQYIEHPGRTRR
jgi:hypothetical protein